MLNFSSKQDICDWLNQFSHPHLIQSWAETTGVVKVLAQGEIHIRIPFAHQTLVSLLSAWITQQQQDLFVPSFVFQVTQSPRALVTTVPSKLSSVKNIIAVSSAKGGVGKSTTSVNLALAIANTGANVGLLDADIYGPSIPLMVGQEQAKPEVKDNKWMVPIYSHGIYTHSIGYLVDKADAAIWRGPMAAKALTQLVNETLWPELDYLIIDMPPGTGDIQITLSQQVPLTSAVIVTTPQDLALIDARKGAAMFDKVDVPVAGIIENMSYHICENCGEKSYLFGHGGAEQLGQEYNLSMLGQIPLHMALREDIDAGIPTVINRPESEQAQDYFTIADKLCSQLYWQGKVKPETISVMTVD